MKEATKLQLIPGWVGGKRVVTLIVKHPDETLRETLKALGYELEPQIANRYVKSCASPQELDAARGPIASLFKPDGSLKG